MRREIKHGNELLNRVINKLKSDFDDTTLQIGGKLYWAIVHCFQDATELNNKHSPENILAKQLLYLKDKNKI